MIDPVVRHVYVHVPFCASVCPFCAFDVRITRDAEIDRYLDRLEIEAAEVAERCEVEPVTVYLGGGTPSQLSDLQLERLVGIVDRHLGWASAEATIELHPDDVGVGRAARLVDLGFTRLSVGVQSTDDATLQRLGRTHDAASAMAAVEQCVATSATVSADLIVAVPGQDAERDLAVVAGTGVDHVSAYTLTIEPGTPFARRRVRVDEDDEVCALDAAARILGSAGFGRYEVSNHARPGSECRHNRAYWRNDCWVGLGPSAGGHEPAGPDALPAGAVTGRAVTERVSNARGAAWFNGTASDRTPCDVDTWWSDAVACGLRLTDGIDLAELGDRVGSTMPASLGTSIDRLVDRRWLSQDGTRVAPTAAGTRVLDRVMAEIWD